MLAHHPLTGAPIRILTAENPLWKEKKTLAFSSSPSPWDRISTELRSGADILLLLNETTLQEIKDASSRSKILFVSGHVVQRIGIEALKDAKIFNLICLEEMAQLYPHLGGPWDGTLEDAVILAAGLLRYRYVNGVKGNERARELGIREEEKPFRLWWVTQYYVPEKAKRRREINHCLQKNIASGLIDKILLLNEKREAIPFQSEKVEEKVIGHRLSYADVLREVAEFPEDVIVAFANADICIDDESWRQVWNLDLTDRMLALLRWDASQGSEEPAKLFGPRADSQDTWVVRAKDVKTRGPSMWSNSFAIPFGRAGCDNAIALEFLRQRFRVSNPALTLKTIHYHTSGVRGYNPHDVVERGAFLYVQPSGIHELEPVMKLPEGMLSLRNCFQTDLGLVFDREKMYIGADPEAQKVWSSAQVHSMTPTVASPFGLISPFRAEDMETRESYVLNVLSRILRLREAAGKGEFFCPETKGVLEVLNMFDWSLAVGQKLPVVRWEKNMMMWCRDAVAFPLGSADIQAEDVNALRRACRGWQKASSPECKRIVLMEDIGSGLVDELERELEGEWEVSVLYPKRSSAERIWEKMCGATAIVCSSDSWHWNWLLPVGARVVCVGSGKAETMSAIAGLKHSTVKGTVEEIKKVLERGDRPIVWIPRSDLKGYYSHAGDSFREMVRLWGEKGYCEVKEHPTAQQVWWGSVGKSGVLLYDRPTQEWLMAAPEAEQEWRLALFGNPKPGSVGQGKAKSWFFWPRRPTLVEELAPFAKSEWQSRPRGVVFYGKVENRVQAKRRETHEWVQACSGEGGEWVLVKGNETPYPLTQKEYLEKLGEARFGLCLAGYGWKCHREIECMAMGCVPLVAPECDMDNYAEPPVEGVHYVRVRTPEEARKVSETMSEEDWTRMSEAGRSWWKKNASCEGSFLLTKGLIEEQ